MLVKVGLFIVACILLSLVLLGIGVGTGFVNLSTDGIAFNHRDDSVVEPLNKPTVISADDLLRQSGAKYVEATTPRPVMVETAKEHVFTASSPPPGAVDPSKLSHHPTESAAHPPTSAGKAPTDQSNANPTFASNPQNSQSFALRIDAGSPRGISDSRGRLWEADSGFDNGQTVDRGAISIENTDIPDIFRTEHYDMSSWSREVPNGTYTVNLCFAETWDGIHNGGERVFHVIVQGKELRDLDVFKETGGRRKALIKTFHVAVTNRMLKITFQSTGKNVPEINGIEVLSER